MNRTRIGFGAGLALMLVASGAFAAQLPDFTSIVKKNAPAVVHVEAHYTGEQNMAQPREAQQRAPQQLPPGVPEIFRKFFFGQRGPQHRRSMPHLSVGTGFIISSDGYILTNDHVVDHADKVTVRLRNRHVYTAKVIGTDKPYDIALLKIDAKNLPTVTIGDSSTLQPGQWVVAIGMPFNFDYTVTQGIVSAVGRSLGSDQPDVAFIQTDVPINHGNSGGPLFNMQGQVVGINSQIYSSSGGYMGVSFSIPINTAMNAVRQLKAKGYVSRGLIGVKIQQVTAKKAKALGLPTAAGALIASVKSGSPGDQAGLQAGDVIQAFNGEPVLDANALPPMVASTDPGTTVTLKVFHQGHSKNVKVKLGAKPRNQDSYSSINPQTQEVSGSKALGFSVENLNADQRQALGVKKGQGVVINDIFGVQARRAGLHQGYVILMVGQHKVSNVKDFKRLTKDVKPGDTVMLLVRDREGNTGFTTVTAPSHD